uniref:Uncharacterized protein n=1 Tax=Cacopsylla melanoneura TaxID=428564 RepID=A0A8D8SWM4_9HEMI
MSKVCGHVNWKGKPIGARKSEVDLFKKKYPLTSVKYHFYWDFFKKNFSYRFGRPQKDTCTKCEELKLKVKSPSLCESAKRTYEGELTIHTRRSKKFYSALKESTEVSKNQANVLGKCFDYMANVPKKSFIVERSHVQEL